VDLLLAAWPLVAERVPEARLCVVGFGTYRDALHRLAAALRRGDLGEVREIAAAGRELEGGPAGELAYLAAFVDSLEGPERARYGWERVAEGVIAAAEGRLSELPEPPR